MTKPQLTPAPDADPVAEDPQEQLDQAGDHGVGPLGEVEQPLRGAAVLGLGQLFDGPALGLVPADPDRNLERQQDRGHPGEGRGGPGGGGSHGRGTGGGADGWGMGTQSNRMARSRPSRRIRRSR